MQESTKQRKRHLRFEHLEARQLLAADTFLVNFQFDEASIPTRYIRDVGDVFGDRGNGLNFGWSSDHTDQSRERNAVADQRLDTLIHFEANQFWEFELANGTYEVTVAVGDPANNDGLHTINVEGVNYWNAVPDGPVAMIQTQQVTVADGRLTIDQGAAGNMATRIDYVHIVGVSTGGNASPGAPTVTEPSMAGQIVNPSDVHMEAVGFADGDGDGHRSSDWEIWTVGAGAEPVWQTLGIEGVERLHTHLGDGIFFNSLAGEIALDANTDYELRVRYRDTAGSVSDYSTRLFTTGAASTIFPLQVEDLAATPVPTWVSVAGPAIELPTGEGILAPGDPIIGFDFDSGATDSDSPGGEQALNVLDGDAATKYLNFGRENTGFIVTPNAGSWVVRSFTITTANDDNDRDPFTYVLQGTNDLITSTAHSNGRNENWVTISSGNVNPPLQRLTTSNPISFVNNTNYTSYRLFFPTVRDAPGANSMQVAEVDFYTGTGATGSNVLALGDFIIPIQDVEGNGSQSDSPAGEGPASAIDGNPATKYLNHGELNSGFIVTPASGPSTVTSFQMITGNDAEERDPTTWVLYGTNDPITSQPDGFGSDENWELIDSGSVALPVARGAAGPIVAVNNSTEYTSYRLVITGVKNAGAANSMQFGEIQFFGEGTGSATPASMRIEAGGTGQVMLEIEAISGPGNMVTDFPPIAGGHQPLRIVIEAGSGALSLNASDFTFEDEVGQSYTVFLPAINLAAGGRIDLWVSSAGATYYGAAGQTAPDFSSIARSADLDIPFIVTQPGFVIEEVGNDYRLPVNIAFVPNPGPNPDDPLYFVTELYGSIQVVTRDGTRHEFATGLLDYNPTGPISGSGEQGLTGITVVRDEVDPEIYHLFVGMLWDNGNPPGGATHYPKVERITSVAGGLAMDTREVILNMQPETQGQSHQISNISIGPDGYLYVHVGDGFNAGTALNLDQFRGSVLRMDFDGNPLPDNPFYDGVGVGDPDPRDYIWAYGLRNPFGGAWRDSDGQHYSVENGPSVDRLAMIEAGVSYGWNGSNASMMINALYNWNPSTAPVNIDFVERAVFAGSQFPASYMDSAFVSESGPTYASGPQGRGKEITQFVIGANGSSISGPTPLVQYVGEGHNSIVALAAGPDGLYFSTLYEDTGNNGPTASGARIYRVRYINPLTGDYDIDGDVDMDDYAVWRSAFGSNLLLAADGNGDGRVDIADYTVWRDAFAAAPAAASVIIATEGNAGDAAAAVDDNESSSSSDAALAVFWGSPNSDSGSSADSGYAVRGRSTARAGSAESGTNDVWFYSASSRRGTAETESTLFDDIAKRDIADHDMSTRESFKSVDSVFDKFDKWSKFA